MTYELSEVITTGVDTWVWYEMSLKRPHDYPRYVGLSREVIDAGNKLLREAVPGGFGNYFAAVAYSVRDTGEG